MTATGPTLKGIDAAKITAWLAERADIDGPLTFELIAGGHSNLTFRVSDAAGRSWALRRPPLGHVLATAHDMGREHRIMAALAGTGVAVPAVVGLCTDTDVNGAPFYVMDFVAGTVVRTRTIAETFGPEQRHAMCRSLVTTLATLHSLDPDDVGLGDLGRTEGYVARQLKRWSSQWQQSRTRDLPIVDEVHDLLAARIPRQGRAGIVHGDYRLDNCMVTDDGSIAAVLDWELCTLGDVLADVGGLWMYWGRRSDEATAIADPPTLADGMPNRDTVAEWYAADSGRDLSELPYYVAFSHWRGACIIEGVYSRYLHGAMGDKDASGAGVFKQQVEWLAEAALAAVREIP